MCSSKRTCFFINICRKSTVVLVFYCAKCKEVLFMILKCIDCINVNAYFLITSYIINYTLSFFGDFIGSAEKFCKKLFIGFLKFEMY
ncbi:hypothetical protein C1I72_04405 [Ehrlichia canis]|uniref:Uncharacterized protein n=1 Tax=Ehrlichia canis (strain Jake) TaxID=269484 RepID=A0ACA6AWY3_EHRCJ|nr:hypothetical protein Ecaj_0836 [Ehrlichia canis str. Jake]AUO55075.1 hypothetical protein C1I72_04405 [Ehrlichia canis]